MLRYLFVDMNAYFASVEQQDDPRLRGRPVAVVPVMAETSSCIAASYEAKACGVKTGTPVWQAMRLCPQIAFRLGRHERYLEVHHELVRAVGRCIPVTKVMSVDEMACRLLGEESRAERAAEIARQIKAEIRRVFDHLTCSVGIGPNVMLAKLASDMQKPDGLTILDSDDLPYVLPDLELTDFPGIGARMERRFHRCGVFTVAQLLNLTPAQMCRVWGSKVHGWRWWYLLRGEEVADPPTRRRTVGHSHVLPPELRTDAGAWSVMTKLVHKAAARLRRLNYWTGKLVVGVSHLDDGSWVEQCSLPHCQDTLTLLRAVSRLWAKRPPARPIKVSVTLVDLVPAGSATPSLFDHDRRLIHLCQAMDRLNRVFGPNTIFFGGMFAAQDAAPLRIPFSAIPTPDPAVHVGATSQRRWTGS